MAEIVSQGRGHWQSQRLERSEVTCGKRHPVSPCRCQLAHAVDCHRYLTLHQGLPVQKQRKCSELSLFRSAAVALLALGAILAGLWQLESATDDIIISHTNAGSAPVTVFLPGSGGPCPVVVIAHGFAGSQQLMLPFALTLARNGYLAVTFDFPGHGRNPEPLLGGLANDEARNAALIQSLAEVVGFAKRLPESDGRVALLGHSMASDIVVRYAVEHPEIGATVAVSMFSPVVTATAPRNLLAIVGAAEPQPIRTETRRVVALAAGDAVQPRTTYGQFSDGTARRYSESGGVEHIAVLYSRQSMTEALGWLNAAFGHRGSGWLDARGPWLGLLYAGLVTLAWPLSRLLPRVSAVPLGAGLGWKRLAPLMLGPAVLTPLILWKLPTDFLPSLLGDYITVHFAVYGLLTGLGLWLTGVRPAFPAGSLGWRFGLAVLVMAAYCITAVGWPADRYLISFVPTPQRAALMLAMLAGTALYFICVEWLIRGVAARPFAAVAAKLCLLLSLVLAIALNPHRLFFLIIIIPVILAFLIVYGLFSAWSYRRTGQPLTGALAVALAFAWAIAVTFPIVGR